jgi:hypothetical protein
VNVTQAAVVAPIFGPELQNIPSGLRLGREEGSVGVKGHVANIGGGIRPYSRFFSVRHVIKDINIV